MIKLIFLNLFFALLTSCGGTKAPSVDPSPSASEQEQEQEQEAQTPSVSLTKNWTKLFGESGISSYTQKLYSDDNAIYVAGYEEQLANDDSCSDCAGLLVFKYNKSGELQWSASINPSTDESSYYVANDIVSDASGNVYVTGESYVEFDGNSLIGDQDAFVVKYDSSGVKQWSKLLGVSASSTSAKKIITTATHLYIVGNTTGDLGSGAVGNSDLFIAKYALDGTFDSTVQLGATSGFLEGNDIFVTTDAIYVTGYTKHALGSETQTGTDDAFIAKYDLSFNLAWVRQIGVSTKRTISYFLSVDSENNAYISGVTYGNLDGNSVSGTFDTFITKFNSSGEKQWTSLLGVASSATHPINLSIKNNKLFVAGATGGQLSSSEGAGEGNTFLAIYNFEGQRQLTYQFAEDVSYPKMSMDNNGNLFTSGDSEQSIDEITMVGNRDIYIKSYTINE